MSLSVRSRLPFIIVVVVLLFAAQMSAAEPTSGPQAPSGLRCEYLENPMGVDVRLPRFFWVLEHPGRGQAQSAYQIMVSSDRGFASADLWDSGKAASPKSTQVVYAGKALQSGQTYFWRVKSWDKDGQESGWSEPARFDTGLFDRAEWKGAWIGGKNQLRKEFALEKRVKRARAYIAGLGYHEFRINGRKAGNHVLDPGWTTYDKRVLYITHDVTNFLRQGPNAVAVTLGNGKYGSRALLLQVDIEFEDGTKTSVVSDMTWKTAAGPILEDSVYNGETYDARLETAGWERPGFDDKAWAPAEAVKGPAGVLS